MSLSCLKPSMVSPPELKIKPKLLPLIYKKLHGLTLACVSDFIAEEYYGLFCFLKIQNSGRSSH